MTSILQCHRMRIRCLLAVLALTATTCGRAHGACILTLLKDTSLQVIHGISVFSGVEGMRLRQGDVVETGPKASAQAQLECSGGAIVELGPSTAAYLYHQDEGAAEIILLSGWLKGETTTGNYRYASVPLTAATKSGNLLLHTDGHVAEAFLELGSATVDSGGAPVSSAKDRIFFARRAGKAVVTSDRPSAEFITLMPVVFRDALPPRLLRFAGAIPAQPRREHDVSYAEIEPLLTLPASWRRGLAERFSPRLQDRSFRQAIETHIAVLPDWKPILYPDNSKPASN